MPHWLRALCYVHPLSSITAPLASLPRINGFLLLLNATPSLPMFANASLNSFPFVDDSLTCAAMIYTKVASLTVICATCSGYATIVCVAVAFLTIIPASSGFPGFGIFIFKDSRGFIALSPLIIAASHPTAARIVTNIKWAFFEYKRTLITCIMFFLDPFQHTPLNLSLETAQP